MLKAHAFGNLVRGLLIDKLGKEFVGKGEGSGRSFACGNVAVDGDEVTCVCCIFKCQLETRQVSRTKRD